MYQLGVCNQERGLRMPRRPGITRQVERKHNKTIACGDKGWRLPLGGQTTSSGLLEAMTSAWADLSHRDSGHRLPGGHARNVAFALCKYVEFEAAHVLRCMAHPGATPVYYIFLEDERCLSWQAEFTNEYFERDDRKFTSLQWGTRHSAAPWLMPALGALEALRLPPPPPPPPARQAHVAERPEHMDTASRRNVHEAFQRHTDEQREAQRQAHFQQGSPGAAGGWPWQCSGLVVVGTRSRSRGRHMGDVGGSSLAPVMCVIILLFMVLAWLWVCADIYAGDVACHGSCPLHCPLDAGRVQRGRGWTVPTLRWSQVFLLGRVHLPALPARLDKPRFAACWAQLRRNLRLHRVAQAAYMALVLAVVIFTAAGRSTRLAHGGWRVMACFFASHSPAAAAHFNRILRFFLLLCGILWVAGKMTECAPTYGVTSPTRSAWGSSPCTSWEAQQSSRQWEPGWVANVAEQDEVLPYTVLDELQPLGDTTVTKDEAAWLDTELNATFGGHPDFKEEHWEEMRNVLRRHASNVVVAGKKDHETGLWTQTRFCVDLRGVNRHSLKDNTLPHRPEELYQKVAKAKFKTTLDATKAFHQIPMATEEDRSKTAFWWKNQLYQYTSMPFGAAGATSAFVRIMDYELRHLQHCTVAYVDDVLVYTDSTPEQHLKDVEDVLRTLGDAGIRLHAGKSTFGAATVDFLGYRIGHNSIGAQEAKCKAIQELPSPQDKTGLRSILGMMNYYKGLVGEPGGPNYSEMARPLNDLLKKEVTDIKAAWGKEQDQALQELKDALCSGRCLRPIDYDRPLILYTDWSTYGIGAVLGQKDDDGKEYICMAISRSLSKTERQYASFKGEMLAVVWAVRTLRQYLHGVHFTLVTDHSPLTTLMEKADLQGQHLRWAISLQEFDFTVKYRPGAKNSNADVPSRYPLPSTTDETGARHEREKVTALHAGVGEVHAKDFGDHLCFMLAGDTFPGEEATPEVQVANYCRMAATEQLGTGPVHRLFDLHYHEELECNHGDMFDTDLPELVTDSGRLARAAWKALSLVRPTRGTHGEGSPAVYSNEYFEGERILKPEKVDTRVLGSRFFSQARQEGVVCYEPCGGLCAGLEMLLRSGMKVDRYLYQDISPSSQTVARARHSKLFYEVVRLLSTLQQLQRQRPPGYILENVSPLSHRPGTKIRDEVFPYIASVIGRPVSFDAAQAGAYAHRLRAYWSNLFQSHQFRSVMSKVVRPEGRIVSSIICKGWHPRSVIRTDRAPHYVVNVVGEPLRALPTIMATQGSRAFRRARMGTVVRNQDGEDAEEESREVNLEEKTRAMGYSASELRMADGLSDVELASILGLAMDRRAMELLMAVAEASRKGLPHSKESPEAENSPGQPIAVDNNWADHERSDLQQRQALLAEWVENSNAYTQQVAKTMTHRDWEEKLRIMCSQGQKGAEGIGAQRQKAGTKKKKKNEWQLYTMAQYRQRHENHFVKEGATPAAHVDVPAWSPPARESEMRLPRLTCTTRFENLMASVAEQQSARDKHRDVHDDAWCLRWLKSNGGVRLPEEEVRRVRRRAARHRWDEATDEIYMVTMSGKEVRIPKPADRLALVKEYHSRTGHWGIRRTQHLLWQRHWWADLKKDVEAVVTQCETCQRVKTHYAREVACLSPLEIVSFMYRWSLDLAWPSRRETKSGNNRVLIMTEHYTRFIICVPIPDKEASTIAAAFRSHVLAVFGAPAECLVDGGKEFEGEFKQLCRDCLIDRRVTSPDSPEGNGLTERVVRTMKFCFKKLALEKGLDYEWDEQLWPLVLSYNAARQESTGVAPFTMLFAQEAVVPPDLKRAPSMDFAAEVEDENHQSDDPEPLVAQFDECLKAIAASGAGPLDDEAAKRQLLAALDVEFYKEAITPLRLDTELAKVGIEEIYTHVLEVWWCANPDGPPNRPKAVPIPAHTPLGLAYTGNEQSDISGFLEEFARVIGEVTTLLASLRHDERDVSRDTLPPRRDFTREHGGGGVKFPPGSKWRDERNRRTDGKFHGRDRHVGWKHRFAASPLPKGGNWPQGIRKQGARSISFHSASSAFVQECPLCPGHFHDTARCPEVSGSCDIELRDAAMDLDEVVSAFQTAFDNENDEDFADLCHQHDQPLVRDDPEPFTYQVQRDVGLRAHYAGLGRGASDTRMDGVLSDAQSILDTLRSAAAAAQVGGAAAAGKHPPLHIGTLSVPQAVCDAPPPANHEIDAGLHPFSASDPASFGSPFEEPLRVSFMDRVMPECSDTSLKLCSIDSLHESIHPGELSVIDDDDDSDGFSYSGDEIPSAPPATRSRVGVATLPRVFSFASLALPALMCLACVSAVQGSVMLDRDPEFTTAVHPTGVTANGLAALPYTLIFGIPFHSVVSAGLGSDFHFSGFLNLFYEPYILGKPEDASSERLLNIF
ncbi:hypothetical protein CYMTET_7447 [Cymbomonas tetramitiformis]|uniref:Integrase catalytic domain-containing protein n=1 Tax=Cymbomonas tetramitiformis TaxID=36881 RepID=A0AAE0GUZ2_9CHLO|nr:hypothetical protein CYMTET_7447 [Cymbomonas tetramitiformis]